MSNWLVRSIGRLADTGPRPEIRWDDVLRIEALGTDAAGAFEVSLTFIHADGTDATISAHTSGYGEVMEQLPKRFPALSPTWREEMARQPWHVERVLYSRAE